HRAHLTSLGTAPIPALYREACPTPCSPALRQFVQGNLHEQTCLSHAPSHSRRDNKLPSQGGKKKRHRVQGLVASGRAIAECRARAWPMVRATTTRQGPLRLFRRASRQPFLKKVCQKRVKVQPKE